VALGAAVPAGVALPTGAAGLRSGFLLRLGAGVTTAGRLLAAAVGGIRLLLGLLPLVVLRPERFGSGGVLPLLPFGLERFLALLLHLHGGVEQIRSLRTVVVWPGGGGIVRDHGI